MKKYFTLAAFAALALFVATFNIQAAPNTNAHKEATGVFNYVVEPPLMITTVVGSQDLGAVCPNCTVNFQDPKCLQWNVTGGASCNVQVSINNTTPPESGVTISTFTQYIDDLSSSSWESFPGEHGTGNSGVWHIGNVTLMYRVCATSLSATVNAAATTTGTDVFTIVADYTNLLAPHL